MPRLQLVHTSAAYSMRSDSSDQELFRASLERAKANDAFLEGFYRRFIGSSEDVAAVFHGQDVGRIARKLAATLELVAESADHEPGIGMYLELLGRVHSNAKITKPMFEMWRDALIETAAECDPLFDAATRASWKQAIDHVLEQMHLGAE